MSIGERILIALERSSKTQADLARHLSTNTSTITGWIKEGRVPSAAVIAPICEFINVSVGWLLTGENSETLGYNQNQPISNVREIKGDRLRVPVYDRMTSVCAGLGYGLEDADMDIAWYDTVDYRWFKGQIIEPLIPFEIYVEGNSMEPKIEDGERILVNPNKMPENTDIALVRWKGKDMVRGIIYEKNQTILRPINKEEYQDIVVPKEDEEFDLEYRGTVVRFLGKDRPATGIV